MSLNCGPLEKISFLLGSTDETLPKIELKHVFDFAYIDGNHGYPFPALDWHYIDLRLKVGGIVGMDNVELRPVREHCDFLQENGTYELIGTLSEGYYAHFYRKLADECREWYFKPMAAQKEILATGNFRPEFDGSSPSG